jgi:hypothetical protein
MAYFCSATVAWFYSALDRSAADRFEQAKRDLFLSRGDQVNAVGSTNSISGTTIRQLLRDGKPTAAEYIPSVVYDHLQSLRHVRW